MTTDFMLPNLWTCHNSNTLINRKILAEEQKNLIMKQLFQIANIELRENDTARKQCLSQLREWIKQNPDIENCITDDNFLLRFLRVKKFSVPMTQQVLLKYLNFRKKFQRMLCGLDYRSSKVNELITNGYIFVSPFRDSCGRRVILYDLSKFNLQRYDGTDMAKAHAITYETLLDDEENQILGVNHVADVGTLGPTYVTLFSITEFGYLIKWGEQSFPMRHKEINIYNLPTPLKYIYEFAKTNMSQKLKDRFMIHDSKEELHKKVDRRCLPSEFGGDMPTKEMIQMWNEELDAKRDRLLSYDSMELLSDRGIIRSKNSPTLDDTGTGSLPGSFRKLELD